MIALPFLAFPCLSLPFLAFPCLSLPFLTFPYLSLPFLALPCRAAPCRAAPPRLASPRLASSNAGKSSLSLFHLDLDQADLGHVVVLPMYHVCSDIILPSSLLSSSSAVFLFCVLCVGVADTWCYDASSVAAKCVLLKLLPLTSSQAKKEAIL